MDLEPVSSIHNVYSELLTINICPTVEANRYDYRFRSNVHDSIRHQVETMQTGTTEFKILMWGPDRAVNVWTVPDDQITNIVEEAVFTIRNSRPNDFIGFSVMRSLSSQELERLMKKPDERMHILRTTS